MLFVVSLLIFLVILFFFSLIMIRLTTPTYQTVMAFFAGAENPIDGEIKFNIKSDILKDMGFDASLDKVVSLRGFSMQGASKSLGDNEILLIKPVEDVMQLKPTTNILLKIKNKYKVREFCEINNKKADKVITSYCYLGKSTIKKDHNFSEIVGYVAYKIKA